MRSFFFYILLYSVLSTSWALPKEPVQYAKDSIPGKEFNQKQLQKYREQKAFQYEEVETKPTFFDNILKWLGKWFYKLLEWLFGKRYAGTVLSAIISALPYIVALLLIFLLLKVFLNANTENIFSVTPVAQAIRMEDDEAIIQNKDIAKLIEQALAQKEYRMALRYRYLLLLQQLGVKQFIQWEPQKTNHDYEREIKDKSIQQDFKELTYLYDYVWYGNFALDAEAYQQAAIRFAALETKIR